MDWGLTSWGGSDELRCTVKCYGLETLWVVRSDRTTNNEEQGLVWWTDANSFLSSDWKVSLQK